MERHNLAALLPDTSLGEAFEPLLAPSSFLLERIVSTGQATPPGQWLSQDRHEWVLLFAGSATLRFEGSAENLELKPGDYVMIPAGCRHRVEWTDPSQPTVWLALHYPPATSSH
ncbi:Cupin domain protein [compost metagenome]